MNTSIDLHPPTIHPSVHYTQSHMQAKALKGIQQHLLASGSDTEFMLRLASHALGEPPTSVVDEIPEDFADTPAG